MKAYEVRKSELSRAESRVASEGTIAAGSEVLAHHFPRFPILPGVLMLDLMRAAAEAWYGKSVRVQSVKRVRFSNYLKPGSAWEARMKLENSSVEGDRWSGEILSAGAKMASAILTLSVKG
ncbi:MAG TPA: hypothetical protein PLY88_04315 [Candidatus Omnitrophota bacterium]|nr:hypothetical protein [Candidatus Omnitrophota bacterium]